MSDKKDLGEGVQGLLSLLSDSTLGVVEVVEAMHKKIANSSLFPPNPIQQLIAHATDNTYQKIKSNAEAIGKQDKLLGTLTSVFGKVEPSHFGETMLAVLNGVAGDYLEEKHNPLRIDMHLKYRSKVITSANINETCQGVNGKILLMVHGSCMNDLRWTHKDYNHGLALAEDLNLTPIFLNYNSGRHISTNGQELSELMETTLDNWPVPVESLFMLSHSMGGLVARSTCHYGLQSASNWVKKLKGVVFLGTPHHGAQLERAGNYLESLLNAFPYTQPLARLAQLRSAGVTDLRYGNVVDEDWLGQDPYKMNGDKRVSTPLPSEFPCYTIAATTSKEKAVTSYQLMGDNLVSLESALGQHKDPAKHLDFKPDNSWIAYETNHLDLLSDQDTYNKIKDWFIK
jgi:pimeloyl-ACP methyl ester carboxylesterase